MKLLHTYTNKEPQFSAVCEAEVFKDPKLTLYNDALAAELGIDNTLKEMKAEELARFLCGNEVFGNQARALAYAGHQFGGFSPKLGDGRALLLGELHTKSGLKDLHLKGTGRTEFSRGGDGLCPLGPALREYLVSEAVHSLGIKTARSLSVVETGDYVYRETKEKGAVVSRVAASHIRIGTFEYFAARGMKKELSSLLEVAIDRHYQELAKLEPNSKEQVTAFLEAVSINQSRMIASWMSFGFVHGVMNTDNMTISGETIDFGPCAFIDNFEMSAVFSYIDKEGRYRYDNQLNIGKWNLCRLAEALLPILEESLKDEKASVEHLNKTLEVCFENYKLAWLEAMAKKFGAVKPEPSFKNIILEFLSILERDKLDFTNSFVSLANSYDSNEKQFRTEMFGEQFINMLNNSGLKFDENILFSSNPEFIPRNHLVAKALSEAEQGDYEFFNLLYSLSKEPYLSKQDASSKFKLDTFDYLYSGPSDEEKVKNTFCGT